MSRTPIPKETPFPLERLGQRLYAVRATWGWSQEQMASALRVDQASVSFWERDVIVPSGSAMVALASLFRVSLEALTTGEGFVVAQPPSAPARSQLPCFRSVTLPEFGLEAATVVDLKQGTTAGNNLSEAMIRMTDALKEGRRIWLVME